MFKGFYHYQFSESIDYALVGKYVGSKERVAYDQRDKLEAYATVDMTLGYQTSRKCSVRVSIKNIFDTDVKYPSSPYSYNNDFPQEGRSIMVTLTKVF
jgi:iron complex outermembrane receptor protein